MAGKARETAADKFEEISGWVGGCCSRSELLIRLSECEGEPEVPSIQRKEAKSRRSSSSLDNYLQRQLINVVFVGGCRKDLLGSAFLRAFMRAGRAIRAPSLTCEPALESGIIPEMENASRWWAQNSTRRVADPSHEGATQLS